MFCKIFIILIFPLFGGTWRDCNGKAGRLVALGTAIFLVFGISLTGWENAFSSL